MGTYALFATLAFTCSALAYIPYVRNIATGRTRPTLSSWFSWCTMDAIIFTSGFAAGAMSYQMLAYTLGSGVVLGFSIYKRASLAWHTLDSFCLGSAVVAMLLWYLSGDPKVGLLLSLFAAIVGSIPFILNIRKDPHNEAILPWVLVLLGSVCQILTVKEWVIMEALTPLTWLTLQVMTLWYITKKYRHPAAT